jgi:hypothetical protein
MVLTQPLFDAANLALAHVIFERMIWDQLGLNPVRLWFVSPSMAPVLRPAAGVRPGTLAVEDQGHRQQKFYPFSVRLHWHWFGGRARLSRLPGV